MVDTENTFQANKVSLMYIDPKLERDYSIIHNKFVMSFGKILMFEMLILNLLELIETIIGFLRGDIDSMIILKIFGISAGMQIFIYIHYKGCANCLGHSLIFSPLQMMILSVGMTEKIMLRNPLPEEVPIMMVALVCVNLTFLVLAYSQYLMFISVTFITAHSSLRFFYFQQYSIIEYLR